MDRLYRLFLKLQKLVFKNREVFKAKRILLNSGKSFKSVQWGRNLFQFCPKLGKIEPLGTKNTGDIVPLLVIFPSKRLSKTKQYRVFQNSFFLDGRSTQLTAMFQIRNKFYMSVSKV